MPLPVTLVSLLILAASPAVPAPPRTAAPAVAKDQVAWSSFGPGLKEARRQRKPMLVQFFAPWCGYCRKMEATTFRDREVISGLEKTVAVKVDGDDPELRDGYRGAELAVRYGVRTYPTHVLLDGEGNVVAKAAGFLEPPQFLYWLKLSLAKAYQQSVGGPRPAPAQGS